MDIELLFQTLLKLYVMLLLGLVLAKVHILDEHSNRSLSQMVVSVTYPLMLLYSMAGQPGERSTALFPTGTPPRCRAGRSKDLPSPQLLPQSVP